MEDAMRPAHQPPQTLLDTAALPWIPLGEGESFKPIRFLAEDRGRILLLRVEPGTVIKKHRHSGCVHAFNLAGERQLDTGELVGPGGYVFEPPGNVDSWMAVGSEPCIVHITAYGAMDYLDEKGRVLQSDSSLSLEEVYQRYCAEHGLTPLELRGATP
jgi:quercetin dioxygenase-like cupin family protein